MRKDEWKYFTDGPENFSSPIYEDRKGRIWIARAHGNVCVYDKTLDIWTSYNLIDHLPATANKKDFADLRTAAIYQDRLGRLMFGGNRGLFIFDEAENRWELLTSKNSSLPHDWITSISEDKSGRIWIGAYHGVVIVEQ
jgi:ligand-binding sensor domain-containing protein